MALGYEQKNANILDRFENGKSSSACTAYRVYLKDGTEMISIDMKKRSFEQMLKDESKMWGDRFLRMVNV